MHESFEFNPALIRRYDVKGPRYTSYPPANHFREDFTERDYRHAILASNEDPIPRPVALYVHIPFCQSPCFYCACTRVIARWPEAAELYLDYLRRDIGMVAPILGADRVVDQVHLGGGTPTYLKSGQIRKLMIWLADGFNLAAPGDGEWSIEIDPRTVRAEDVRALAAMGFNRMSFGVQDFDPEVQAAVNRVQPVDHTLAMLDTARATGVGGINVDLIYGLPRQTTAGFARTLDIVIEARPSRIAAYSYAHLPSLFRAQAQIREEELPDPGTRLDLLRLLIERLTVAGYVYIGMDHFALPEDDLAVALRQGRLRRDFQGYSTRSESDLIGLGMSAIGSVADVYIQNEKNLDRYYAAIDQSRLPVARGFRLSRDDRIRRAIIQAIMCTGIVDYTEIETHFQCNFAQYFAEELPRLAQLADDGLVTMDRAGFSVTPAGRLLLRAVAMVFDAYLPHSGQPAGHYSRII
jgi:oxygen-independent coproporphyrinogen-3 oxidase